MRGDGKKDTHDITAEKKLLLEKLYCETQFFVN